MTNLEHQADMERMQTISAEWRALELLAVVRKAVAGGPHWRLEAENLLVLIDYGVPPARVREQLSYSTNQKAA